MSTSSNEIIKEELNFKNKDIVETEKQEFVSNLNPNAPCFYLPEPEFEEEDEFEEIEVLEQPYDAFIKQYSSNLSSHNKSDIDILYCLFPGYSMDTLKKFYHTQNSSLSSTITLLLNFDIDPDAFHNYMASLASQYTYYSTGEGRMRDRVPVDLSETNFPSLPQNGSNQNNRKSENATNSEKKFSDIVKMKNKNEDILNLKNHNSNIDMRNYLMKNGWSDSSKRINIPWVETGKEVSEQYEILRKEASQFASLRNACFENVINFNY